MANLKRKSERQSNVPAVIQVNLQQLLACRATEGILVSELPQAYRRQFGAKLRYQDFGFRSLMELCQSLKTMQYYPIGTADFKLFDKKIPMKMCLDNCKREIEVERKKKIANNDGNHETASFGVACPNVPWTEWLTFVPHDIFPFQHEIERAFVPNDLKEMDELKIVVAEIYDPSKFWIYLRDTKLDTLMTNIQKFYNQNFKDYVIPKGILSSGWYCVKHIFGEYQRALILDTQVDGEDAVRLYYIDFGTTTKESSNDLCFLTKEFAKLPAQAIRARLASICPVKYGAPWSMEASNRFEQLVSGRQIAAKISYINRLESERYVEVFLADTTNDQIFYLNDLLVKEGWAQYNHKPREEVKLDANFTPLLKEVHTEMHLYPTFGELEYGVAPGTADMKKLHELKVPINFIYPQYFNHPTESEANIIAALERLADECVYDNGQPNHLDDKVELLNNEKELTSNPVVNESVKITTDLKQLLPKVETIPQSNGFSFDEYDEPSVRNDKTTALMPHNVKVTINPFLGDDDEIIARKKQSISTQTDTPKFECPMCEEEAYNMMDMGCNHQTPQYFNPSMLNYPPPINYPPPTNYPPQMLPDPLVHWMLINTYQQMMMAAPNMNNVNGYQDQVCVRPPPGFEHQQRALPQPPPCHAFGPHNNNNYYNNHNNFRH